MKVVNFIFSHFYFIMGGFISFIIGGLAIDAFIH